MLLAGKAFRPARISPTPGGDDGAPEKNLGRPPGKENLKFPNQLEGGPQKGSGPTPDASSDCRIAAFRGHPVRSFSSAADSDVRRRFPENISVLARDRGGWGMRLRVLIS